MNKIEDVARLARMLSYNDITLTTKGEYDSIIDEMEATGDYIVVKDLNELVLDHSDKLMLSLQEQNFVIGKNLEEIVELYEDEVVEVLENAGEHIIVRDIHDFASRYSYDLKLALREEKFIVAENVQELLKLYKDEILEEIGKRMTRKQQK